MRQSVAERVLWTRGDLASILGFLDTATPEFMPEDRRLIVGVFEGLLAHKRGGPPRAVSDVETRAIERFRLALLELASRTAEVFEAARLHALAGVAERVVWGLRESL